MGCPFLLGVSQALIWFPTPMMSQLADWGEIIKGLAGQKYRGKN